MPRTCPHTTVALSGPDNVGKTTNCSLLAAEIFTSNLLGSISAYDSRWNDLSGSEFASWWFEKSSTEEHVKLVFESHLARSRRRREFSIEDRGYPMLRSVCIATEATRNTCSIETATRSIDQVITRYGFHDPEGAYQVLLLPTSDVASTLAITLERESENVSNKYRRYQESLAQHLLLEAERGRYDYVIWTGQKDIAQVQLEIRGCLMNAGFPAIAGPAENPKLVVAVGGLSEAGKSNACRFMTENLQFTHLKISYLLDQAARTHGLSQPYEWSDAEQGVYLASELLRYGSVNRAPYLVIDSIHRYESTLALKSYLGDRLKILYLEADLGTRLSRTSEAPIDLQLRDDLKTIRGAQHVKSLSDSVIVNTGTLSHFKAHLWQVGQSWKRPSLRPNAPAYGQQPSWLPVVTQDQIVQAVFATGSTLADWWIEGWSDLDYTIVLDNSSCESMQSITKAIVETETHKVGLTFLTLSDIRMLRIPPRTLNALRCTKTKGLLFFREGFVLPDVSESDCEIVSLGELGVILATTRRLIGSGNVSVRSLYKHLVLLAKIILRFDNIWIEDTRLIVAAYNEKYLGQLPAMETLMSWNDDRELFRELCTLGCAMLNQFETPNHASSQSGVTL